jgi:hypothetical protein
MEERKMRLIDADALLEDGIRASHGLNEDGLLYIPFRDVTKSIKNAPTVDAIPVSWLEEKLKGHPELRYATTDGIYEVLRLWSEWKVKGG